jgi:Ca2+:H+ antiporter
MLFVCIFCWAIVFYIPMAKLLWVLLCHLNNEPLSLHFRSPPAYVPPPPTATHNEENEGGSNDQPTATNETTQQTNADQAAAAQDVPQWPLEAGQPAPRVSRKKVADAKRRGRIISPRSTVLLCTYKAAGLEYYKYTLDGVNIWFVNLMSLVFFVILDFFLLEPYAEKHHSGGLLKLITGQGFIFFTALLGVIPLSYFIGMAVASISAQSSIGTGAFINASFGSAIEILLYSIALTQSKGELVEGSIVGSILAGVLLMPGLSMIGGAFKRKEQRFNARSAGVTSMMLIVAVIGVFTPTLFYEIYGSVSSLLPAQVCAGPRKLNFHTPP